MTSNHRGFWPSRSSRESRVSVDTSIDSAVTLAPNHYLSASIMVVDDEAAYTTLLCNMLGRAGYADVRSTSDPRAALAMVADRMPDVLLLDLRMPDLDGLTLLQLLRDQYGEQAPFVLMLTADGTQKIKSAALSSGARDFLAKPFTLAEVVLRTNNLADLRLSHLALRQQNLTLASHVLSRTLELEEARLDVLERLGRAAEYRDDQTGQHTRRVGRYAAALARQIGRPAAEVELIARGAPLHDIGKIAIPDHILLKPGPLNPEELRIMQSHAQIGARLLSNGRSALLDVAREIALTHHERWDGQGYPHGLAGAEIPLAGRIVAICDVYDALSHDRPYRRRYSEAHVREYMLECSGGQFDPDLVRAFLDRESAALLEDSLESTDLVSHCRSSEAAETSRVA